MSAFGNSEKDDLEYEIRVFLEEHSIAELLEVVAYNIGNKEFDYLELLKEQKNV